MRVVDSGRWAGRTVHYRGSMTITTALGALALLLALAGVGVARGNTDLVHIATILIVALCVETAWSLHHRHRGVA